MLIDVTHLITESLNHILQEENVQFHLFSTFLGLRLPVYNSGICLYKTGRVFACVCIFRWRKRCLSPNYWSLPKKNLNWGSWINYTTHGTLSLLGHSSPSHLSLSPSSLSPLSESFLPSFLPFSCLPFHPSSLLHLFLPFFLYFLHIFLSFPQGMTFPMLTMHCVCYSYFKIFINYMQVF